MIRRALDTDILDVARLLFELYKEVFAEHYTDDRAEYISEVIRCMNDPKQKIFIDDELRGFFIVVDSSEPLTPTLQRFEGTRVYIVPEHRGSRVLKEFYSTLFKEYPTGDIIGFTEVGSDHIPVLEKRHTRIANVYRLNRS